MAETVRGSTFWVSTAPRPSRMSRGDFETVGDWIKVGGVGRLPRTGTTSVVISQPVLGVDVYDKGKGFSEPGDGTLECKRMAGDPGQKALRAMCLSKARFATRIVHADGTVKYNRGLVSGPMTPGEAGDDFILESYAFAWVQLQIVVDP